MQSAGGLTIEQVLARSLRMPRRRLQNTALGKRLEGGAAGGVGAGGSVDVDAAMDAITSKSGGDISLPKKKSKFVVPGVRRESLSSRTWSKRDSMTADEEDDEELARNKAGALAGAIRRTGGVGNAPASAEGSGSAGELFHMGLFNTGTAARYPDPYPHRPTLKHMPKTNFVRTARDLSTHLSTCRRMGDWKDALSTYMQASAHFLPPSETTVAGGDEDGGTHSTTSGAASTTVHLDGDVMPVRRGGRSHARETPSVYYGHIFTLIDCLVEAGKGPMVEDLVRNNRLRVSPDVALLPHRPSPGARRRKGGTGADLLSKGGLGSSVDSNAADDVEDPSTHEAVQEAHADEEDVAVSTEIDANTPLFPSSESEKAKRLEDRVLGSEDGPVRKTTPPPTPIYSPFLIHLSFTYTRQGKWPEAIRLLGRMHANALRKYQTTADDETITSFKRLPRPPPVAAFNRVLVHLEDLSASENDLTAPLPDADDISVEGRTPPTSTPVPECAAWEVALQLMDRMKANYEPHIEECKKYDRKAYCARYGLAEDTAVVDMEVVEQDIAARKEKKKLERAAERAKAREAKAVSPTVAAAATPTSPIEVEKDLDGALEEEEEVAAAAASSTSTSSTTSTDAEDADANGGLLSPAATPDSVLTEAEIRAKIGFPPVPAGTIPTGTTYALVMQILEHANQHELADKLLMTMPEAERESIMASYSALIYLWSETKRRSPQFFGKNKR